jgi:ribonuclease P protein subunit RPR2
METRKKENKGIDDNNCSNKKKCRDRGENKDKFKARKSSFQDVARKRIAELFLRAEEMFSEDSALSNRYMELARKLSTKYKVAFSKAQKARFCKVCGAFLVQGENARVRLSKGNIVVSCNICKGVKRFKYK